MKRLTDKQIEHQQIGKQRIVFSAEFARHRLDSAPSTIGTILKALSNNPSRKETVNWGEGIKAEPTTNFQDFVRAGTIEANNKIKFRYGKP